jgi:hypothetical protein
VKVYLHDKEENIMRMFQSGTLVIVFGCQRQEVTGKWIKFHEKLKHPDQED